MPNEEKDRLEKEALESLVASDLSEKMKQWSSGPAPQEPERSGRRYWWLLVLLPVLALGGWFWLGTKSEPAPTPAPPLKDIPDSRPEKIESQSAPIAEAPHSPTHPLPNPNPLLSQERYLALAQAQYQKPDFGDEIRGSEQVGQDWLIKARRALHEGRFQAAISALQQAPEAYANDAAYLRAHALFGLKKYAEAARVFQTLQTSIRYREAAEWYGTLALLPDYNQNKPLIIKQLNKIARDQGHAYRQNAAALLKSL